MDPVLAGVYRRGQSLRRQRAARRLAAGALSLQLLVALPYALRQGDDAGGRNVRVVAPAGQEEQATTTTEVPVAVVAAEEPATTTVPAPTPTTSTTASPTTTSLVCRNSSDPRCGPLRWDPEPPPNEPMTAALTFSPAQPRVGEEVVFTVVFHDPDASDSMGGGGPCFGDDSTCVSSMRIGANCEMYGPWDPPPRRAGDWTWQFSHTFEKAGTFTTWISLVSGTEACSQQNVYGSSAGAEVVVVVDPA